MPTSMAAVVLAAALSTSPEVVIEHQPVTCVLADAFPRLSACVEGRAEVAAPKVYFRGHGDRRWYSVEMRWDGACYTAALPKPLRALKRLDYYVAAEGVAPPFVQAQTRVASPEVRSSSQGCPTPFVREARVRAVPTEGELSVPAGFAREGLVGLPQPARRIGGAAVVIGAGAAAATTLGAGAVIAAASDEPTPTAPPPTVTSPPSATEPPSREPTASPAPTPPSAPEPTPTLPPPTTLPPPPTPPPTTLLPLPTPTLPVPTLPSGEEAEAAGADDDAGAGRRPFAGTSSLEARGGRGQIILNGTEVFMPGAGRVALGGTARVGTNRLELHVVAADAEGTWRIDLRPEMRIRPKSWRVVAGDVLAVGERSVVVRARGRDARAVLTFDLD